ncbi:MAG TPA: nuclear transport factor 2 family protein [Solirubrobacteraceae bacterium]|nr:nuclear transport factor 2 family protein [Solirubrobacteraceae bacterium]
MPWLPEFFTVPALEEIEEKRHRKLSTVPYYDGVVSGQFDALVESFAGEPLLFHPVRGRIRGARAFLAYVTEMNAWLAERNIEVEDVDHLAEPGHGFEEVVLHLDAPTGRVDVPVAIAADREPDGRIDELRLYFSSWPFTGRHLNRPPLLQPDPVVHEADVIAEYQRALSAGDVDAIVAAFEPDGYVREPAGSQYVHRGHDALRGFYTYIFSNGGGIPMEQCSIIDDGRACAVEYNVVRWGVSEVAPEAAMAVYVRGESGKLAAARIYDDVEPPLGPRM